MLGTDDSYLLSHEHLRTTLNSAVLNKNSHYLPASSTDCVLSTWLMNSIRPSESDNVKGIVDL